MFLASASSPGPIWRRSSTDRNGSVFLPKASSRSASRCASRERPCRYSAREEIMTEKTLKPNADVTRNHASRSLGTTAPAHKTDETKYRVRFVKDSFCAWYRATVAKAKNVGCGTPGAPACPRISPDIIMVTSRRDFYPKNQRLRTTSIGEGNARLNETVS